MKVTTYEILYHEDHGAYFEAQVWKKDSSIVPSLFFSHLFIYLVRSLIPTCGGITVSIILSSLGTML